MCRHIGYIGNKEFIDKIILEKSHSLIDMAFQPKEMENAKLNADGFGIGWSSKENANKFFLYKNDMPIWNDQNLKSFSKNIQTNLMIGNVRSSTLLSNIGYQNSHPFVYENLLFSHNGFIEGYETKVKSKLLNLIDNKLLPQIKGNTDSELIFFIIVNIYKKEKSLLKAINKTVKILSKLCKAAMLNFIIAEYKDKKFKLYATKTAIKLTAPSLYFQINENKNIYISSEKLDKKKWVPVKNNSLIECSKNKLKIIKIDKSSN